MPNELNIKNGIISKGQVQLEGGLISTGSTPITITNPVTFSGSVTIDDSLNVDSLSVSTRTDISGNNGSFIDASLFGSFTGPGLVIPTSVTVNPVIGSMYVDIGGSTLNIWDGSAWLTTTLS